LPLCKFCVKIVCHNIISHILISHSFIHYYTLFASSPFSKLASFRCYISSQVFSFDVLLCIICSLKKNITSCYICIIFSLSFLYEISISFFELYLFLVSDPPFNWLVVTFILLSFLDTNGDIYSSLSPK
jgi:hypothetical protein